LTNLEHLSLDGLSLGCVPSQLVKLTCLQLSYGTSSGAAGPRVEHLSTLTALCRLEVRDNGWCEPGNQAGDLSGIAHLTKLSHLSLKSFSMAAFNTANTSSLAS
jgi:hypothetical protein